MRKFALPTSEVVPSQCTAVFWKELQTRTQSPILGTARHTHIHICIPNLGTFIQKPPYWGLWLRYFSSLSLRTFLLLSITDTCVHTEAYKKSGTFCSGLLDSKMISSVCHNPTDSCLVLIHGKKWNTKEPLLLFASCLLCHCKWIKS